MTNATDARRVSRLTAARPAGRPFLLGFAATLALGTLGVAAASAAVALSSGERALPGVTVGGVSVAGLDREAARERLVEELPPVDTGVAIVATEQLDQTIAYEDLGRAYDLDHMLDRAFGIGRGDGLLADGLARLRALVHPPSVGVAVTPYEPERLERAARAVAATASTAPVQAYVERTTFAVHPSTDGWGLDAATVRDALAAALDTTSPDDVRVELAATALPPTVSTDEAEAAAADAAATARDLELTIPGAADDEAALTLAGDRIARWLRFGPGEGSDYAVHVDAEMVAAGVAKLAADVDRDPVDATFTVAGGGLGGVVGSADGRRLDAIASADALLALLRDRPAAADDTPMELAVDVTEPALTTADAEALLPQMRLVSSWTTNYVPGDGNGYGANISIGAWDLDGYNIAPGEWFSFWGGIGPVTLERGYQYGGAIINGRSVPNGALAGGICSTSTTLFNAAMRMGLEIGERENHFYYIDRYPTGLDATVLIIDDAVTDMTFRNDTEYPIVIRGYGTPGQVTFQMWSVPTGRTVALSTPLISDRGTAIETTQLDTSMAPGTSRRVEFPHDGFNVSVSRTVYAADGAVLHQNTWYSDYHTVNGITLVGPAPPATADPPDEDDA
ncbi:MAG TPA: VanW family protein [Candidatus Limnocylindria bacterium]